MKQMVRLTILTCAIALGICTLPCQAADSKSDNSQRSPSKSTPAAVNKKSTSSHSSTKPVSNRKSGSTHRWEPEIGTHGPGGGRND
jgi:hypothetical protein